tara:strand:- start:15742 stop:16521 length:780 start_codon:yes stop_codon:yes gene_type:complete
MSKKDTWEGGDTEGKTNKDEITFPNYYDKIPNNIHNKSLKSYKNIPGWMNDAEWIFKDCFGINNDIPLGGEHFVEIGTLLGQSSIRMAQLIKKWNTVHPDKKQIRFDSIDTLYFIIHSIRNGEHPPKFLEYINLYETGDISHILQSQLKQLELDGLVNYICCDSKYAHNIYRDNSLDFVWVDGSHEPEDVERDVKNFWPKVKPGGLIAGDDYVYEAVAKKIHLFVDNHIDEISKFEHPDLKKKNSGNYFRVYKKHTHEK